MTVYCVDAAGRYIGAFVGAEPPPGSLTVPFPPLDARQVWDGQAWGVVPFDPAARVAEILTELAAIDAASARPLRAILVGSATDEDRARLTELDEQAAALRAELAALESPPAA